MLSFDKLQKQKKVFLRIAGISFEDFNKIIARLAPEWNKFLQKKKAAGRNSKLKTLEDEVLLLLIYYRFYVSFQFLALLFDLDKANICRHIQRIEPLLVKVVRINKDRTLTATNLQTILLDATEIQIQRPQKGQKKFYSGKKKRHMMKIELQVDQKKRIINISEVYPGRSHDFKIRKQSAPLPRNIPILADSGYQGLQKVHPQTILPYKRRRNTVLTPEQREHNRTLSSKRVFIEHVFAQLKKFKILGTIYRNFRRKLHLRFNIIAGIYNLRYA